MSTLISDNIKGRGDAKVINVFAGHATSSTRTTNLEQGLAKLSIKFNGASATAAEDSTGVSHSFNVASLVDVSTGRYKININNDMTDGDYAISHSVSSNTSGGSDQIPMIDSSNAPDDESFGVMAVRASFADVTIVCCLVHGDLA
jgi:hypothetical protein